MAIGTPAVLTEGGSTTDGTVFATGAANAPTGGLLVLLISAANATTTPDVTPTITGHGTWTLAGSVVDAPLAARAFTAPATGTTGALTITYPSTIEACAWHLIHIPGADTAAQSGTYGGNTTSPSWALPAPPAATSAAIFLGGINGSSATITPDGGATTIGTEQDQSAPSLSSRAMWANPATQSVGYTSSAAAVRKVGISLELTEAAPAVTAWTKAAGVRVPLIARTHTYLQRVTAAPAGFGASFGSTFGG